MNSHPGPRRVLVTGAAGFIGRWLLAHLREAGAEAAGLGRSEPEDAGGGPYFHCDLGGEPKEIGRALREAAPEAVVHLAAAVPSHQEAEAWELLEANARASQHLFDACAALSPVPRVLVVSSSAVYGPGQPGAPIGEEHPMRPVSQYGVSKVLVEMLAVKAAARGLPVIRARLFNVIGPGQTGSFALPRFCRHIARIERGLEAPEIETGALDSCRDFVDVRDAAAGLALVCASGETGGVYNLCSGRAVRMREVLDGLLALSSIRIAVRVHEGAQDLVPYQCGDPGRALALGWRPHVSFEQTLRDTLDDWRRRVARCGG